MNYAKILTNYITSYLATHGGELPKNTDDKLLVLITNKLKEIPEIAETLRALTGNQDISSIQQIIFTKLNDGLLNDPKFYSGTTEIVEYNEDDSDISGRDIGNITENAGWQDSYTYSNRLPGDSDTDAPPPDPNPFGEF